MQTLEQFIQQATHYVQKQGIRNVRELERLFSAYDGDDWPEALEAESAHVRILFQDKHLRLTLIYWDGFQRSEKHGHPGEGGLIKVLSGTLLETRFDPSDPERKIGAHLYNDGDITYIHDHIALHIMENPSDQPAVSLHCYVLQAKTEDAAAAKTTDLSQPGPISSAA